MIAQFNFNYFKEKYFNRKFTWKAIIGFVGTSLGYISIIYIPCYYFFTWIGNKEQDFYNLIIGLLVSLLLCAILITVVFATEIYSLHKIETLNGKLKVKKSGSHVFIAYKDIFYVFSEDKVVYLVREDGSTIVTDFTLNEVEDLLSERTFFRANRQTVINFQSVEKIDPIENGKLLVKLKPLVSEKNNQIVISRYKKKAFQEWLEQKVV